MSKSDQKFSKYFNLPNPGLRSYFSSVRKGQPDEYRTTFYRGKSVQDVLSGWDRTLKSISKEWPSLYEFETDLREKVGPMSIMQPLEKRMPDIDAYYDLISSRSLPLSKSALDAVLKEWGNPQIAVRSEKDTVRLMKKSTNSGSPYFSKRKDVLSKTVPSMIRGGKQYLRNTCWEMCAVLGWRGQEGGPTADDVKQRVVWMFPFALNIAELRVYQPLIEYAQKHNLVPAWVSMDAVDATITKLFDTKSDKDVIVCTDFSKFDQHFNKHCQDAAEYVLKNMFSDESWFRDVYPRKFDIPLAYDWGCIREGYHGMASGSGGTNADETLLHRALQYECAQSKGQDLNPNSMCLGDDGILTYPGITAEDVMRSYTAHGLSMNSDKQYVSTQDCTFLRRWHHVKYRINGVCVGVYSTHRALGRLCEQERYYDPESWGPKMVALRQLSILENCKYHPLREKFADYCMKGDKYRLGLDIPGFLDNISSEAKKAIDNMPDFLGYTKSMQSNAPGIESWWIVKYLQTKR